MWNNITYNLSWHKCWDHLIRLFAQDTSDIVAHISDPDSSGSSGSSGQSALRSIRNKKEKNHLCTYVILSQKDSFNLIFLVFARKSTLWFLWLSMELCVITHIHTHSHIHIHLHICLLCICPCALSEPFRGYMILESLTCYIVMN